MNTKDKDIRDALATKEVATVSKIALLCHKSEIDNAKFWYIIFVYNFINRCIDQFKINFIEGDTDSLYYAISGNPDEDSHQGFEHIIKDEIFYKENVYK
jgi:hypothetical protein